MQLKPIVSQLALGFVVIGLAATIDSIIPGFSVPGNSLDWFAAAIACALVGGAR